MNHEEFMNNVIGSMAATGEAMKPIDEDDNRVDDENDDPWKDDEADDPNLKIHIPTTTGKVFEIDARSVDWDSLSEQRFALAENETMIRAMVHDLITHDHLEDPEGADEKAAEINKSLDSFLDSFGIKPGYDEMNHQVKPFVMALARAFDALTLAKEMERHITIHDLAKQIFSINTVTENLEVAEMDEMADGLISEDRENYSASMETAEVDDHDVSGLITE